MRLTCFSYSDTPIRPVSGGWSGSTSSFGWIVPTTPCPGASAPDGGAFLAPITRPGRFEGRAPERPVPTFQLSPTTTVDTAGWTEVVIQREPQVLSDVIVGFLKAEANASINFVSGAASSGGLRLRQTGGAEIIGDTDLCRGYSGVNRSSFSCSNNNEVTI